MEALGCDGLLVGISVDALQASGESAAVFGLNTEFVEDADAGSLRCGFDEPGEDELEEGFVVNGIETEMPSPTTVI